MSEEQLRQLRKSISETGSELEYWTTLWRKNFEHVGDDLKEDQVLPCLEKMYKWIDGNVSSPFCDDFKAQLTYCELAHGLFQNEYKVKLFNAYIKRPRGMYAEYSDNYRRRYILA